MSAGRQRATARPPAATALAALLVLAVSLSGCAVDPERAAREKAIAERAEKAATRIYKRPFDTIWNALLAAAEARRLAVVEVDRSAGVLELRHGISATSPGERIDIRVRDTGDSAVSVEIRSRPLTGLSLPPDWQRQLFGDLELAVAPRRTP